VLCLPKASARCFLDRIGRCANPASFVAKAWGCKQATYGSNVFGKVANTWFVPPWWDGSEETVRVRLTPYQLDRWNRHNDILHKCFDKANPHAALVRRTLMVTTPGPAFDATAARLAAKGERDAVKNYRRKPQCLNLTRDGDVQSNVSRLPDVMRAALLICGMPVAEFDVKSAHAVLLGMFYEGETGEKWAEEKARFDGEVLSGFETIYGTGDQRKKRKRKFLSALNQETHIARYASAGYREFERLFPLLAAKVARMKRRDKNAVGRRLRCAMADIQNQSLIENHADGIPSIPIVDSAVVAMPEGVHAQPRTAFRTSFRLGARIAELTNTAPLIKGSNGENFRFFL
jgi:hypothetical protein